MRWNAYLFINYNKDNSLLTQSVVKIWKLFFYEVIPLWNVKLWLNKVFVPFGSDAEKTLHFLIRLNVSFPGLVIFRSLIIIET